MVELYEDLVAGRKRGALRIHQVADRGGAGRDAVQYVGVEDIRIGDHSSSSIIKVALTLWLTKRFPVSRKVTPGFSRQCVEGTLAVSTQLQKYCMLTPTLHIVEGKKP